jgi:hypothetical protein
MPPARTITTRRAAGVKNTRRAYRVGRVRYTAWLAATSITEGPLFRRICARLRRVSEGRQVKASVSALPGWLK